MRVLMIGSDRRLLSRESASAERHRAYAEQFDALDIIVFTRASHTFAPQTLATGLHVHPTASRTPLGYGLGALRIALRLPRPDVVSVQDPFETGLIGLIIARMRRAPLHVQVHTDFLAPEFAAHSFVNRLRVVLAGYVLRRAARVRVVSERIRKTLVERYGLRAPISVLPIFVDVEKVRTARAGALANEFVQFRWRLLVVARLEAEKNVWLALESFAAAAPKDACLIIVGEGSERRALEKQAMRLRIVDRVFFEGENDPLPYYALADLVLVPSKYEGYGLVVIEALAAGKPALSTDVGIAREAGAIIAAPERFAAVLSDWFERGVRVGELLRYPYADLAGYVRAYCDDIAATPRSRKG